MKDMGSGISCASLLTYCFASTGMVYIATRLKEPDDGLPERNVVIASWRQLIDTRLNTKAG